MCLHAQPAKMLFLEASSINRSVASALPSEQASLRATIDQGEERARVERLIRSRTVC